MLTKGCLTPGARPTIRQEARNVDLDAKYREGWAKAVNPHVKLSPKLKRALAYMLKLSLTAGLTSTKEAQRQDKKLRDVAHSLKRSPTVRAFLGIK